ncbi:hypothetical protein OROGR_010706 [Orobanche gracilis]
MRGETFSSASSVTGASVRRRRGMVCDCGIEASLVTLRTNENDNFGRRFYGCGRFKNIIEGSVDFFVWYDEIESSPRDKKVIKSLLRKIEELQNKQSMLMMCCVVGWGLFAFVLVLLLVEMKKVDEELKMLR